MNLLFIRKIDRGIFILNGGNDVIEVGCFKEKEKIKVLPHEIQILILNILQILDTEYGANRNRIDDDGGYVIIVEKKEELQEIKEKTYIDCNDVIAEYVEKIVCKNGEIYTNSLILCNNDFAITLIIPLELTPQNLKDNIIE